MIPYIQGTKKVPLHTFFIDAQSSIFAQAAPKGMSLGNRKHLSGDFEDEIIPELSPSASLTAEDKDDRDKTEPTSPQMTFVGTCGIRRIAGLTVAFLSGRKALDEELFNTRKFTEEGLPQFEVIDGEIFYTRAAVEYLIE
jgi:hypothetical protein